MTEPRSRPSSERAPSVLVVLVVRNAGDRLRECLSALRAQTYARLGIVAVDNDSTDGSAELLRRALGDRRVVSLKGEGGLARSVRAALEIGRASCRERVFRVV